MHIGAGAHLIAVLALRKFTSTTDGWITNSTHSASTRPTNSAEARAPARKIDLTKLVKPQSKSSRSVDSGQSQSNVEQRSRSGSIVQSDVDFTFPSRTTASSGIVASKPPSKVVGPTKRRRNTVSKPMDSEPLAEVAIEPDAQALGGISEEDDSLEKEMAMSSPMKGSELRAMTKVCFAVLLENDFILFQSLVKVKAEQSETKPRKRATVQDLPKDANENAAWTRVVVPNFINLILAGERPWIIADDIIIAELQRVWDHAYGMKVEFTIEKGTVPFELVSYVNMLHCMLYLFHFR